MKGMPDQSVGEMEVVQNDGIVLDKKILGPVVHGHRHNLKNRFELKRSLGEGTYGKVKLAVERSSGQQVIWKCLCVDM